MRDGVIWRIIFDHFADRVLEGARHPEGRFHHSGQHAFYASPSPESAMRAVAAFCRPGDPQRQLVSLRMRGANLLDLRDPRVCADLGLPPDTPSVPWQPQRLAGLPATAWRASDAVRDSGADGMIYASRTAPERWHLVLFHWNTPGHAQLRVRHDQCRPADPLAELS